MQTPCASVSSAVRYKMGIITIPTFEGLLGGTDEVKYVKWVSM